MCVSAGGCKWRIRYANFWSFRSFTDSRIKNIDLEIGIIWDL